MIRVIRCLMLLGGLLLLADPTAASAAASPDTELGVTKGKEKRETESQGTREEKGREQRRGKRTSESESTGLDRQTQQALKAVEQGMTARGLEASLDPQTLFVTRLREWEAGQVPLRVEAAEAWWTSCKVLTAPRLPRDVGLTAERGNGWIDSIQASWLQQASAMGVPLDDVADVAAIRAYRNCLARYGVTVAQATLYLMEDLKSLPMAVVEGNPEHGPVRVRGLGYEDVRALADVALRRAMRRITDGFLQDLFSGIEQDQAVCTFDHSLETVRCGGSRLSLTAAPTLSVGGVTIYGDKFAGLTLALKVSRTMSYAKAIERLKGTSRYAKTANEIARQAEQMEKEGQVKEAMVVRQRGVSSVLHGQVQVSPDEQTLPLAGGGIMGGQKK